MQEMPFLLLLHDSCLLPSHPPSQPIQNQGQEEEKGEGSGQLTVKRETGIQGNVQATHFAFLEKVSLRL